VQSHGSLHRGRLAVGPARAAAGRAARSQELRELGLAGRAPKLPQAANQVFNRLGTGQHATSAGGSRVRHPRSSATRGQGSGRREATAQQQRRNARGGERVWPVMTWMCRSSVWAWERPGHATARRRGPGTAPARCLSRQLARWRVFGARGARRSHLPRAACVPAARAGGFLQRSTARAGLLWPQGSKARGTLVRAAAPVAEFAIWVCGQTAGGRRTGRRVTAALVRAFRSHASPGLRFVRPTRPPSVPCAPHPELPLHRGQLRRPPECRPAPQPRQSLRRRPQR